VTKAGASSGSSKDQPPAAAAAAAAAAQEALQQPAAAGVPLQVWAVLVAALLLLGLLGSAFVRMLEGGKL
jgi:hypothetical protein